MKSFISSDWKILQRLSPMKIFCGVQLWTLTDKKKKKEWNTCMASVVTPGGTAAISSELLTEKNVNYEIFLKNGSSLYLRWTISHPNSHLLESCQPWFKNFQKLTENRSHRIQAEKRETKETGKQMSSVRPIEAVLFWGILEWSTDLKYQNL